jgi:hypothetical protein
MKKDIDYDEITKSVIMQLVDKETNKNGNNLDLLKEFAKGFERANPNASVIPESLFRELLELQRDTKFFIRDIVRLAIRRLLDDEKSDEEDRCVYVDGEKWPWPLPEHCRI